MLHLLADQEAAVVVLATKILCRLLIINGPSYVKKFGEKTGGFVIMRYRMRRWWSIPTVWVMSLAVLFGRDIATIELDKKFDLFGLLDTFSGGGDIMVIYPEVLPVITVMLQTGIRAVTKDQEDSDSPLANNYKDTLAPGLASRIPTDLRRRSMSLRTEDVPSGKPSAQLLIRNLTCTQTRIDFASNDSLIR